MGVVLKINAENVANFCHEGFGAGFVVVAFHIVTPVDFVDFGGGSTGGRDLKVAREGKHGNVAGLLVEADNHDGIGELCTIVGAITLGASHIVATSTKGKNVGATVLVGL